MVKGPESHKPNLGQDGMHYITLKERAIDYLTYIIYKYYMDTYKYYMDICN
jgi:hypothetical protein